MHALVLTSGEIALSCSSLTLTRGEVKQKELGGGGEVLWVPLCAVNNFSGGTAFVRGYVHYAPCLESQCLGSKNSRQGKVFALFLF